MKTIVYGASDDLIEVDGLISEEFNPVMNQTSYLGFSNGVVLSVKYDDDGTWRIRPIKGSPHVALQPARGDDAGDDEDGVPGYSDKAILGDEIEWVIHGDAYAS